MNLLEILKNQLASGDTMGTISNLLGENKAATTSGLDAILPTLLGSVIQKGATTEGAGNLLNVIKSGGHDGSILDNIGGLLGNGDATKGLLNTGGGLVSMLLGDKVGGVVSLLSNLSGLKSGSTSSLLSMAAPLLMGLIGKHSAGQSASGLASMLMGQSSFVKDALPSGISNLLGLGSTAASTVSSTVSNVKSAATGAATNAVNTVEEAGSSILTSLTPWLLGAAVLAGLFMAYKSCSKTDVAPATVEAAKPASVDTTTKTVAVGEAMKVGLPGGVVLDVPKGSLEDKIVTYIQSKDSISKSLWFDFDRLLFDTGKSTLKAESAPQLANAVAIMKAFPKVKIKLGGYTDNVGNPASNLKLSSDRAKNVMMELVKLGVSAGRLSAEGYGDKNPVASNDTKEGQAQNRRISISVREK
jgi:OmpA-OmpF porin, OOP family